MGKKGFFTSSKEASASLTFLGWESCDHTGPVLEGATLRSTVTAERSSPLGAGLHVVDLRSIVTAERAQAAAEPLPEGAPAEVLDWRFSVLM